MAVNAFMSKFQRGRQDEIIHPVIIRGTYGPLCESKKVIIGNLDKVDLFIADDF